MLLEGAGPCGKCNLLRLHLAFPASITVSSKFLPFVNDPEGGDLPEEHRMLEPLVTFMPVYDTADFCRLVLFSALSFPKGHDIKVSNV